MSSSSMQENNNTSDNKEPLEMKKADDVDAEDTFSDEDEGGFTDALFAKELNLCRDLSGAHIFVLGNTGVGKSTFLQWLAGCKFHFVEVENEMKLNVTDEKLVDPRFAMGAGFTSVTSEMAFLKVDPNLCDAEATFVDTPGFEDTNGWETDIINFLRTRHAMKVADETRYVLLVNGNTLRDNRGKAIADLMSQVVSVLGGDEAIKLDSEVLNSCFFLVTHPLPGKSLEMTRAAVMKSLKEKLKSFKQARKPQQKFQRLVLQKIVREELSLEVLIQFEVLEQTSLELFFQFLQFQPQ